MPNDLLSRVTAYDWFSSLAADPAGYAVTGILVAHVGAARGLATMIAVGAVVTLVIPFLGPVRRLEAARPGLNGDSSRRAP